MISRANGCRIQMSKTGNWAIVAWSLVTAQDDVALPPLPAPLFLWYCSFIDRMIYVQHLIMHTFPAQKFWSVLEIFVILCLRARSPKFGSERYITWFKFPAESMIIVSHLQYLLDCCRHLWPQLAPVVYTSPFRTRVSTFIYSLEERGHACSCSYAYREGFSAIFNFRFWRSKLQDCTLQGYAFWYESGHARLCFNSGMLFEVPGFARWIERFSTEGNILQSTKDERQMF